ncbi:hypothetical protein N431DRAFT_483888 [Stipitochalara longipes BDJ]|nr:hypothetical protein N431DRAFT_483888 [Stipitochalara longipes BDJ]
MSTNTTVHVGFWTNQSKGPIFGSTLTLSSRNGNILIAILALFVSLSGGQSWSILSFLAHQVCTTKASRDGLWHQQQAVLRNNRSDVSSVWQLMRISWAWRQVSVHSIRRSLGLILLGLLHLGLFFATGALIPYIVAVDNQVLLGSSPYCGPFSAQGVLDQTTIGSVIAFDAYTKNSIALSAEYVSNCLAQNQTLPECNTFKQPRLNWTSARAPCPFGDEMCLGPENGAIKLDTGLLDSRDDFGVNGQGFERISYRRASTCVPITTQNFTTNGTSSIGDADFNYTAAFYGPNQIDLTMINDTNLQNATYILSNYRDFALPFYIDESSPYTVDVEVSDVSGGFSPIPELFVPNRSLSLIFASFTGSYTGPSDDLWIPAHQNLTQTFSENGTAGSPVQIFSPDSSLSVLACVEQQQFCNPSFLGGIKCTKMLSPGDFLVAGPALMAEIGANDRQFAVASTMYSAASLSTFYYTVLSLDVPLLADSLAGGGVSVPLPNNQWELEVENWFQIGLNNVQRMVVSFATGPPSQFAQYTLNQAKSPAMQWMCENQIIQREDFTSFSTLALALIFGLGGTVIALSLFLEVLVGWARIRFNGDLWRQEKWWMDGTLQLQRAAFENSGLGGVWRVGMEDVPISGKGKVFPGLGMGKSDGSGGKIAYTKLGKNRSDGEFEFGCRGESQDESGRKVSFELRVNGKGKYWGSPNRNGFF